MILSDSKSIEWQEELKLLLPAPDFNELFSFTPLHKAVLGLSSQALDAIIQADPLVLDETDSSGRTALAWACYRGDAEATKMLLSHGADCNRRDKEELSPLSFAAKRSLQCAELLLKAGADVNVLSLTGLNFLHRTVSTHGLASEGLQLAKLFVQAGIDVNSITASVGCETPLILAQTPEIARYLLEQGADPNTYDSSGNNALSRATLRNQHEMVEFLLQEHFDHTINLLHYGKFVHLAAQHGDTETIRLLAQGNLKPRDINVKNKAGLTPVQLAMQRKNVDHKWREYFWDFLRSIDEDQPHSSGAHPPSRTSGVRVNDLTDPASTGIDNDLIDSDTEYEEAREFQM